jgi:NDP-sugar pyrophosphorylase family protein
MASTKGAIKKAVIFAAGAGGRIRGELDAQGIKAKANLKLGRSTLLGTQLKQLQDLGIQEVFIFVRDEEHLTEFQRVIAEGKYPRGLKYRLEIAPTLPKRTVYVVSSYMKDPRLTEFRGKDPIFVSLSDTYFFGNSLKTALRRFSQRKESVFVSYPYDEKLTGRTHGRVIRPENLERKKTPNISIVGYALTPQMHEAIKAEHSSDDPRFLRLLTRMAARVPFSIVHLDSFGINDSLDYEALANPEIRRKGFTGLITGRKQIMHQRRLRRTLPK